MKFHRVEASGWRSIVSSLLFLIVSNLLAVWLALRDGWGLSELMSLYWAQSVIIGAFNFLRIMTFRQFDPAGMTVNKRPIDDSKNSQFIVGFFFLLHYGLFHLGYCAMLSSQFPCDSVYTVPLLLAAGAFLISHFIGFLRQHEHDLRSRPSIGTAMFFPYLRVLPMHLVPFFGSAIASKDHHLEVFIGLKILSDVAMQLVEESQMAKAEATDLQVAPVVATGRTRVVSSHEPAGPAGPHWRVIGWILIAISIIWLMLLSGGIDKRIERISTLRRWAPTPCTVLATPEVSKGTRNSGPMFTVQFSYEYNGRTYMSSHLSPWFDSVESNPNFLTGRTSQREAFPAGRKMTCYVNPGTPVMAVLFRDPPAIMLLGYIALVLVPVLLLIGGFIAARSGRITPVPVHARKTISRAIHPEDLPLQQEPITPTATPLRSKSPASVFLTFLFFGALWNAVVFYAYFQMLEALLSGVAIMLLPILFLTLFAGVGIGYLLLPLLMMALGKFGIRPFGFSYGVADLMKQKHGVPLGVVGFWGGVFQAIISLVLISHAFPSINQWRQMRDWQPVRCEIISSSVQQVGDGSSARYDVAVEYRYRFRERDYVSNRYRINSTPLRSRETVESRLNRYGPGTQATCFVDPANPQSAVLNRDVRGMNTWRAGMGALLVILGAVMMRFGSLSWVKTNRPASNVLEKPSCVVSWSLLLFGWCCFAGLLLLGSVSERETELLKRLQPGQPFDALTTFSTGTALMLGLITLAILGRLLYHSFAHPAATVISGSDFYRMYEARTTNKPDQAALVSGAGDTQQEDDA